MLCFSDSVDDIAYTSFLMDAGVSLLILKGNAYPVVVCVPSYTVQLQAYPS